MNSWKLWIVLHWLWIFPLRACVFCQKTRTFLDCVQWVDTTWSYNRNFKLNAEITVSFEFNIFISGRPWKLRKLVPAMMLTHIVNYHFFNDIKLCLFWINFNAKSNNNWKKSLFHISMKNELNIEQLILCSTSHVYRIIKLLSIEAILKDLLNIFNLLLDFTEPQL